MSDQAGQVLGVLGMLFVIFGVPIYALLRGASFQAPHQAQPRTLFNSSRWGWGLAGILMCYLLFMHSTFFIERQQMWRKWESSWNTQLAQRWQEEEQRFQSWEQRLQRLEQQIAEASNQKQSD